MFVGLKPLCDGFLAGCRPYLAIDSTHLTGKYRGQLATACAIDGHNWLYPVAYAIIDSKTTESWDWFMEKLHQAIGCPPRFAICSHAGKSIDSAKRCISMLNIGNACATWLSTLRKNSW